MRVADVAWATHAFLAQHSDCSPFPSAPDICIEVRSPSNTDAEVEHKTHLLLQAGAQEVWIVTEAGDGQIFDSQGLQAQSRFAVTLALPSA